LASFFRKQHRNKSKIGIVIDIDSFNDSKPLFRDHNEKLVLLVFDFAYFTVNACIDDSLLENFVGYAKWATKEKEKNILNGMHIKVHGVNLLHLVRGGLESI